MNKSGAIVILAAFAATLATGCTFEGEEGELRMQYRTRSGLPVGAHQMAAGSSASFAVRDSEDPKTVIVVTGAESSDEETMKPSDFFGSTIVMSALAAGEITLTVDAERAGASVTDRFQLGAEEVTEITFDDPCKVEEGEELAYLSKQSVDLRFKLRANGKRVLGYGYYPLELQPAGIAELLEISDIEYLRLQVSGAGELTLQSTLDETTHTIHIVDEEDIDDMEVELFLGPDSVPAGTSQLAFVLPYADERRLCQSRPRTEAENLTPEVCELTLEQDMGPLLGHRNGVVIETLSPGTCSYVVSLPDALGGEGLIVEDSFEVTEPTEDLEDEEDEES